MKCLSYCRIVGGEAEKGSKSGCRSEKGNKDREEQGKQLQILTLDRAPRQKNTDLIIDCVKGMGGMFSLDNGTGRRFLTRSEICIPEDTTIN